MILVKMQIFLLNLFHRTAKIIDTATQNSAEKSEAGDWDREIDAKKNLLLPGFKNAHTLWV